MTKPGYHYRILFLAFGACFLACFPAFAWHGERPFPFYGQKLPPVIGNIEEVRLDKEDSLIDLARRRAIGFTNLTKANPEADPWYPEPSLPIHLPLATIPPAGLTKGITINLAEMRLYHVTEVDNETRLQIYPIGVGRDGLETPEGKFRVTTRVIDPVWKVPAAVLAEEPDHPRWVKPGPENPLGNRWLGLSRAGYGIHGTNRPYGIGRRISSGCIRLYPKDIEHLFERVALGTAVKIVYQPIKIGFRGDQLYLVAHPDFDGRSSRVEGLLRKALKTQAPGAKVNWKKVDRVLKQRSGIPIPVGTTPNGVMASPKKRNATPG